MKNKTSIQKILKNELEEGADFVWRLKGHYVFDYSDGAHVEKYLESVFRKSKDLTTHSRELETHINDWPSEYHLSSKRAQLLSGFTFDRSLKVLEVGCGCGAITRFLGENFDQVVSIEGTMSRARLAKLRTCDLQSVSVICAPFQELQFAQKFDLIFCIGVFEYSASFIEANDPYNAVLKYFSDLLTPNGSVIIAIENQFGLKYFSGAQEDHTGAQFEGLEGYRRNPEKVRTFGKTELNSLLEKHFTKTLFFYPYPDYKIPDCVISSEFLSSRQAGELVSQIRSRDYLNPDYAIWSEPLTTLEIARNGQLDFFSNSFLVFATRGAFSGFSFEQLAILFSSARKPEYSTKTRIIKKHDGEIYASKQKAFSQISPSTEELRLIGTETLWIDAYSIHTQAILNANKYKSSLEKIFEPCMPWVAHLLAESHMKNGHRYLDGTHVDSTWANSYLMDGELKIIDREWQWKEPIKLNVVIIRAIYSFLYALKGTGSYAQELAYRRAKKMIIAISATLGIALSSQDFEEFIRVESRFQSHVFGIPQRRHAFFVRWFLIDSPSLIAFRRIKWHIENKLLPFFRAITSGR